MGRWSDARVRQQDGRTNEIRERCYDLNDEEMNVLRLVGSFRSVESKDVPSQRLERLLAAGLMEKKSLVLQHSQGKVDVLVLTRQGRDYLRSLAPPGSRQRYYAGLVKPAEVAHDLAIYPAFRREAEAIEKAGGRIRRVVLDYELKSIAASRMNRPDGPDQAERRREIADELKLPVVKDRLALPDLRIEYEASDGAQLHRDLEVVTKHYRGAHLAGKQQAGFRLVDKNGARKGIDDDHHLAWL